MGKIIEMALRREVVCGAISQDSSEIIDFLQKKRFLTKDLPKHVIKEISNKTLTEKRKKGRKKSCRIIRIS